MTRTKDWKTLERAYRKMLKRLPQEGNEQLKVTLWSNLAEIYRSRLQRLQVGGGGLRGGERGSSPGNVAAAHQDGRALRAADCRTTRSEHVDAAVKRAPDPHRERAVPLRELPRAVQHLQQRASDRPGVLHRLGAQLPQEGDAGGRAGLLQPAQEVNDFVMARQRLSEDSLRRHVFHPDQDLYLTGILGLIAPAVAAWRAVDLPGTININGASST